MEKRGKVEDKILLESYNELREKGTYWVTPERMKDRMGKLQFVPKAANIVGLQIADLIAYPIACHILLAAPASGRRFLKTPSVDQRICGGLLFVC